MKEKKAKKQEAMSQEGLKRRKRVSRSCEDFMEYLIVFLFHDIMSLRKSNNRQAHKIEKKGKLRY